MRDVLGVHVLDSQEYLLDEIGGLLLRQALFLGDEVEQLAALQTDEREREQDQLGKFWTKLGNGYSQLQNEHDVGGGVVHLMQVDDVGVLHLGQDVDFFADVLPGHTPP